MFLSQACKNCPPAAEYGAELAQRPGVVALAWHIDYWNMMAGRKGGRWKDPFARAEFSERQRRYNESIRHRSSVFTPQAIINGEQSVIGSKRNRVEDMLAEEREKTARVRVAIATNEDGYTVKIEGEPPAPCEAYLVTFHRMAATDITGGDNAGLRFEEANVVADVTRLGAVSMATSTFSAPRPAEGMGCAVLVQESGQGPIIAASYCP